jgi:hypothetical protein
MTIYTLENETNNITAFATAEAAAAASQTPFDVFTNQDELAELIGKWPADRLVATYNSLPGVKPLKSLKDAKAAASKIWERVAKLGQMVDAAPEAAKPAAAAKPKAGGKAKAGAQSAKGAPAKGKASKKAAPAKPAPKAKKGGQAKEAGAPREGSKMLQAVALMQRKGGVTISELMATMGWQKHTCRGFVAGALKKAGYTVESFKPEGGERTYRISK